MVERLESLREVSTHSRPKAAADKSQALNVLHKVSTHSRPKAAASSLAEIDLEQTSFNTQPPEGGCEIGGLP